MVSLANPLNRGNNYARGVNLFGHYCAQNASGIIIHQELGGVVYRSTVEHIHIFTHTHSSAIPYLRERFVQEIYTHRYNYTGQQKPAV